MHAAETGDKHRFDEPLDSYADFTFLPLFVSCLLLVCTHVGMISSGIYPYFPFCKISHHFGKLSVMFRVLYIWMKGNNRWENSGEEKLKCQFSVH